MTTVDTTSPTYCEIAKGHPYHGPYHNNEYGFPVVNESILFERLTLEIFQAGLSWLVVLKKRQSLNAAFKNFDVECVSKFDRYDVDRLMNDISIIRNRLKIEATIFNANSLISLRQTHGSFANWLFEKNPLSKEEWCQVFKKNFKFIGQKIVDEFLMSIGYIEGAHHENCHVYHEIKKLNPIWLIAK